MGVCFTNNRQRVVFKRYLEVQWEGVLEEENKKKNFYSKKREKQKQKTKVERAT